MEILRLSFILILTGCYSSIAIAALTVREESERSVVFDYSFSEGREIKGIVLKREKILGRWLLQLNSTSGMLYVSGSKERISTNEFAAVVTEILEHVSIENNVVLDEIQFDIGLVDSIWNDAVATVLKTSESMNGKVMHKDRRTTTALQNSINISDLTNTICDIVLSFSYSCYADATQVSPIAFKPEHLGESWSKLAFAEDAGIDSTLSVSIELLKIN